MLDLTVSKITIADSVAQQIKQLILDQKLRPGDRLPSQRDLANQLRVGRPAIREALMKLESMGLVQVSHGRNTIVKRADLESLLVNISPVLEITETEVVPLLEAKQIIETRCAELAADRATPSAIEQMSDCLKLMEKYRNNPTKYAKADYEFHLVVVTSAGNPIINEVMKIIGRMIWKAIEKTVLGSGLTGRDVAMEYHHRIYEAIRDKDGALAAKQVHDHLAETIDRYSRLVGGSV